MYYKIILSSVLSLSLIACTTPAVVQKADSDVENKAKSFQVDSNKSKIYFINGKMTSGLFNPTHSYPSDLAINDIVIGSMNKENVLVVDLLPGTYEFYWLPRSTDMIDKKSVPQKTKLKVDAGQVLVLQGDYSMGGAAYFGLLGSMVSPPTTSIVVASREDIKNKVVVSPQNCKPSICAN
jgi:hypothetical protein